MRRSIRSNASLTSSGKDWKFQDEHKKVELGELDNYNNGSQIALVADFGVDGLGMDGDDKLNAKVHLDDVDPNEGILLIL